MLLKLKTMNEIIKHIELNEVLAAINLLDDCIQKSVIKRHYYSVNNDRIVSVIHRRDFENEMNQIAIDVLILAKEQKK